MAIRDINLLPGEMLYQRRLVRHVCFWTGCFALSVTLVFGIYLYQRRSITAKKHTLMKLEAEHQQLVAKIEEIKQIQEELEKLAEKQAILSDITRNQPNSEVLLKLAEIMNEHTWLTQLVIERDTDSEDRDNDRLKLKLRGFCHSNEDMGDFLIQLSTEPLFKGAVLNYAKEATETRVKNEKRMAVSLIEFEIDCHV